jgi:hypothetical protein
MGPRGDDAKVFAKGVPSAGNGENLPLSVLSAGCDVAIIAQTWDFLLEIGMPAGEGSIHGS